MTSAITQDQPAQPPKGTSQYDEPQEASVREEEYLDRAGQHAASRHAVWVGAAAIITDEVGRVLLVHPTYRKDNRWLLPGGVVELGEHPHVACRREITDSLGKWVVGIKVVEFGSVYPAPRRLAGDP
ncbi:NUDIX hydrolase [Streptomyces sp. NPDC005393]|uniref:NUDIX hydrolase n=1 Tax=Streptomyces sp. NPDC005393 TaxID=3157041 RepID=UPI0033BBA9C5